MMPDCAKCGHCGGYVPIEDEYACPTCQDTGQVDVAPDTTYHSRIAQECPDCAEKAGLA